MRKGWFQDRSIFFQLLVGGFSILGALVLLWMAVNAYFLHQMDRANHRRWLAHSIAVHAAQAGAYEKHFVFEDVSNSEFHTTGDSPSLRAQRALIAQINAEIDSLLALSAGESKADIQRLKEFGRQYSTAFDSLVAAYRVRGTDSIGVAGEWEDAMHELIASGESETGRQVSRLVKARGDYLLDHDTADADIIRSASNALRGLAQGNPALRQALARQDTAFQKYLALQQRIGDSEGAGLRGQMSQVVFAAVPIVDSMVSHSIHESERARGTLIAVAVFILLAGLAGAGVFFYNFANTISSRTERIGEAAAEIGRGHFNVRTDAQGGGELGRLGAEFNRMAENLAALIGVVQQSGVQINTSAMEIAATSRQQQATAHQIAATTSQVGRTAQDISSTSQDLAANVKQVAAVAERTATLAGEGQTGLSRMEATMRQIVDASAAVNTRLGALSEKAANINSVVVTISKVADQTNLLSLNAAIEAEKAGEYGRGFSVVATEIRRLADQTAAATGDIEQIVKEMQSAVTAGVMGMDKFSDEVRRGVEASDQASNQLSEIIRQVQALTPLVESVNEGMQSQAVGAQEISQALAHLGASAQQTAESLAQSNAAIEQLNDASRNLQSGVSRFSVRS